MTQRKRRHSTGKGRDVEMQSRGHGSRGTSAIEVERKTLREKQCISQLTRREVSCRSICRLYPSSTSRDRVDIVERYPAASLTLRAKDALVDSSSLLIKRRGVRSLSQCPEDLFCQEASRSRNLVSTSLLVRHTACFRSSSCIHTQTLS